MNLFFLMNNTDFASYADGSTPYTIVNDIEDVMQRLQAASKSIFCYNQMKANADKFRFICGSN